MQCRKLMNDFFQNNQHCFRTIKPKYRPCFVLNRDCEPILLSRCTCSFHFMKSAGYMLFSTYLFFINGCSEKALYCS